jgi:hypothetical protein
MHGAIYELPHSCSWLNYAHGQLYLLPFYKETSVLKAFFSKSEAHVADTSASGMSDVN